MPAITTADLKAYVGRVFARDTLKIGIVGNVDAATAGAIVDRIFGALPAKADLVPVAARRAAGPRPHASWSTSTCRSRW